MESKDYCSLYYFYVNYEYGINNSMALILNEFIYIHFKYDCSLYEVLFELLFKQKNILFKYLDDFPLNILKLLVNLISLKKLHRRKVRFRKIFPINGLGCKILNS